MNQPHQKWPEGDIGIESVVAMSAAPETQKDL